MSAVAAAQGVMRVPDPGYRSTVTRRVSLTLSNRAIECPYARPISRWPCRCERYTHPRLRWYDERSAVAQRPLSNMVDLDQCPLDCSDIDIIRAVCPTSKRLPT